MPERKDRQKKHSTFYLGVALASIERNQQRFPRAYFQGGARFVFALLLRFRSILDHCSEPQVWGREIWATFPTLTQKPCVPWEVSELLCVLVASIANRVQITCHLPT